MKRSNSSAFSAVVGICIVAVILVLANWLLGRAAVRVDLTEDQRYSLSSGTKEILSELNSPVTIRFYFTKDSRIMPESMKLYGKRVADLLAEYANASNGMVSVETYNPEPDTDAESTARLDGVRGQVSASGEAAYLGLAVNCLDATETLPVLALSGENNLEFDISRAIYRVTHPEKITVGILSTLPVMGSGGGGNPFMQQQRQPAWLFIDQLRADYDLQQVEPTATGIPDSVKVLIVHHPRGLGEETLYAIDQYLLRGGKVIAMVDPSALMDQSQRSQFGFTPPTASNMEKLFAAWGITFDEANVVADRGLGTPVERGADGRPVTLPAFLSVDARGVNADDVTCNSLDRILLPFAGSFSGTPVDGLSKTVLLHSTADAMALEAMRSQQRDTDLAADFKAADNPFDLAIRLTGSFPSAFPKGKPGAENADSADAEDPADNDPARAHFAKSAKPGAVVLIGDADFVHEQFWAERQNFFGQQLLQQFADNASFLQNVLEQLSGDDSLISIRSRGVTNRFFTKIRDMEQKAEERYQAELKSLNEDLQEAQRKISELERTKKDANQRLLISPEQQAELEKFQEKQANTQKRLREVRKELRKDVDLLEGKIMSLNILAMPFLVTLAGITVAETRRRRRASHQKKKGQ